MKKVIIAMLVMFILIVPFGGIWGILLQPLIGGGVAPLLYHLFTYLRPVAEHKRYRLITVNNAVVDHNYPERVVPFR